MRQLFQFLPYLLLLAACQEIEFSDEELATLGICGTTNPLEDLPWLAEMVSNYDAESAYCQPYQVVQGTYQREAVFIIQLSGALCCTCAGNAVYNCNEEVVFVCEPEKEKQITNKREIWSRSQ